LFVTSFLLWGQFDVPGWTVSAELGAESNPGATGRKHKKRKREDGKGKNLVDVSRNVESDAAVTVLQARGSKSCIRKRRIGRREIGNRLNTKTRKQKRLPLPVVATQAEEGEERSRVTSEAYF
jgi:hypothetical protein